MIRSYVAIGDSFTEGLGDWWPDGSPRGWADRLAEGLARGLGHGAPQEVFTYANLAIRGRKLGPILDEQLDIAIDMHPDLISLNGGGNDMLRPGFGAKTADEMLRGAVEKIRQANIPVLLLAGPNPARHLPMGHLFDRRGSEFVTLSSAWASTMSGVYYCDNFHDQRITAPQYWSEDGLHLDSAGHLQVALNCLRALSIEAPAEWEVEPLLDDGTRHDYASAAYYRQFVLPWIKRRLTGRSSGDGRTAKRPQLAPLTQ